MFSRLVPYNENKVALDLRDTQCSVGWCLYNENKVALDLRGTQCLVLQMTRAKYAKRGSSLVDHFRCNGDCSFSMLKNNSRLMVVLYPDQSVARRPCKLGDAILV